MGNPQSDKCSVCNGILIELPLFSSIEKVCPFCNPEKVPTKRYTIDEIREKLGYNKLDDQLPDIDDSIDLH